MEEHAQPTWTKWVLYAAALYNICWGAWVIFFPSALFDLTGTPAPNYLELWQCIGMIVGVYGVGYAIAAENPIRHWPIILVGFLGKILGPIGFIRAYFSGVFNARFGWNIVTNDIIWWLPFGVILYNTYKFWSRQDEPIEDPDLIIRILEDSLTQRGDSLAYLSMMSPVLVVFLRHAGCPFCKESLADLAKAKESIQASGVNIVLISMLPDRDARRFFAQYGLDHLDRISDAKRRLYRAFGLKRGLLSQLFGFKVWWRGLDTVLWNQHWFGRFRGDMFQMPGVFLLEDGGVTQSFRHWSIADRPDYEAIVKYALSKRVERPRTAV